MSAAERAASMSPEELIAVITRGLDADEEAARDATPGPWWEETPVGEWGDSPDAEVAATTGKVAMLPASERGVLNALHVERHDPSRVLADIRAKRDLLAAAQEFLHEHESGPDAMARLTLESLARPYLAQETP